MAIYALRGACAAAYLGYGYAIYRAYNPLYNKNKIISSGPIKDFVNQKAEAMGFKKELIVVRSSQYQILGSGVIKVLDKSKLEIWERFMITRMIAEIKTYESARWWSPVPLIAAVFATILLNYRSPHWACIAGLAAGIATALMGRSWLIKSASLEAFKHCSKQEIQRALETLRYLQTADFRYWIRRTLDGPIWYQIRYFEKYLQS